MTAFIPPRKELQKLSFPAQRNRSYMLDSRSGNMTVTLPADAVEGDSVDLEWVWNGGAANTITITTTVGNITPFGAHGRVPAASHVFGPTEYSGATFNLTFTGANWLLGTVENKAGQPGAREYKNASFTAVAGVSYVIRSDAALTITMPANPVNGDTILFDWNYGSANITLAAPAGKKFYQMSTTKKPFNTAMDGVVLEATWWCGGAFSLAYDGFNWTVGIPADDDPAADKDPMYNHTYIYQEGGNYYKIAELGGYETAVRIELMAATDNGAYLHHIVAHVALQGWQSVGYTRGEVTMDYAHGSILYDSLAISSNDNWAVVLRKYGSHSVYLGARISKLYPAQSQKVANFGSFHGMGNNYGAFTLNGVS
jgi:hypothetical protein